MSEKKTLKLVQDDPWLKPYEQDINARLERFEKRLIEIGDLEKYADGHHYFVFNLDSKKNVWTYREWAPGASALFLIGDFNCWNRSSHPLQKNNDGIWEISFPENELQHKSLVKVHVVGNNGANDRIPAYIKRVLQNPETLDFSGQIWNPPLAFKWSDQNYKQSDMGNALIYECHVGMGQEKLGYGTYLEFAENVLPRIQKLGYNSIQMMAIQEHPYYGSFGYHVSNYFAPSSKFGTPEDLKYLINKAHGMGIAVIMDIVHSHAVKNFAEGLNFFDGTDHQYFHEGPRGYHEHWDSKVFNYGKPEVQQFLLSNIKYWMDEFHFDGFRFDGITSMLYLHHGMFMDFDHYDIYFKDGVEWDAITYLQLANTLCHQLKNGAITIAEDMSGMPGICKPVLDGGIGFDYRLGMGIPDYWIKILKEKTDEQWDLNEMWGVLQNRRFGEKTIAYAESHDQAMVGDKTIAFWLMDKEMYTSMSIHQQSLVVDRGIALHKLIRLFTISLGGEGYLTFFGNEFGHPEWLDFPREGNNWSYQYARRQWSLVDNKELKYQFLNNFDSEMIHLIKENKVLESLPAQLLNIDSDNKIIAYERNNLHFIVSFNPSESFENYHFPVNKSGKYKIVLSSDDYNNGGFKRTDPNYTFETFDKNGTPHLSVYIPNRTALVFKKL